jgi:hypothetical protein
MTSFHLIKKNITSIKIKLNLKKPKTMINTKIVYLLLVLVAFSSCESDDNDGSTTPDNPTGISLDQLSNGEGVVATTGAANLDWNGNAFWELTSTSLVSGGVAYNVWQVTIDGPTTEDYIRIQIVEPQESSTQEGPDDGTYVLGGSMDENDISVYTSEDSYFFEPSSSGQFELTNTGDVLEITLEATGLEKAGIGSSDELIDVNLAVKASNN